MPSCLARRREAARRSFGLTLASLASQEVSVAVCTCDYIDLPTNVTLTNPGFVRLVNEANYGLKIATTSLGITASGTDTTLRFVVAAGGNVGIGTPIPGYLLHVVGSGTNLLHVEGSTPDVTLDLQNTGLGGRLYRLVATNNSDTVFGGGGKLVFFDASPGQGVARLTIDGSGNVGIGVTNPSQPLAVAGVIQGQALALSGDVLLIGNDTKLVDVDVANTTGLYGQQDPSVAALRLGLAANPTFRRRA